MLRLAGCLIAAILLQSQAPEKAVEEYERHRARLAEWADPLAERLMGTLPDPIDGLDEWAPWDYQFREPPNWGCSVAGCTVMTQMVLIRPYVIREPSLADRVEALEKKTLELATKLAGNPSDQALAATIRKMTEDVEVLQKSVRRIALDVHVNGRLVERRGAEGAPVRAGTVGGYPLLRYAFSDASYEPTPVGIRLSVILGPEAFTPEKTFNTAGMKAGVRTLRVSAAVTTRREHAATDEALARKLLEKIDFTGLAKLLDTQ